MKRKCCCPTGCPSVLYLTLADLIACGCQATSGSTSLDCHSLNADGLYTVPFLSEPPSIPFAICRYQTCIAAGHKVIQIDTYSTVNDCTGAPDSTQDYDYISITIDLYKDSGLLKLINVGAATECPPVATPILYQRTSVAFPGVALDTPHANTNICNGIQFVAHDGTGSVSLTP